jgi:DNA-binding YbaB/EbfC family protein
MNPAQLQKMMKQAQKLQTEMQNAQAELERKEFSTSTGGNAVTVVMTGDKKIVSLVINPDVIDPEDKEMLEDMIKTAINNLTTTIDQETETTMSAYTQGLPF